MTSGSRHLLAHARKVARATPVMVIEGARELGKRRLALEITGNPPASVLDLDDARTRRQACSDPVGLLESTEGETLVVAELQRAPHLLPHLQDAAARGRRAVVTSSVALTALYPDPPARALRLHPLSLGEVHGTRDDWVTSVLRGRTIRSAPLPRLDYARLVTKESYTSPGSRSAVRSDWVRGYVRRSIADDGAFAGLSQGNLCERLFELLSGTPGAELNLSELSRSLPATRGTVERQLRALEALFLITRIPATSAPTTKRPILRDRIFAADPRIFAALAGHVPERLADLDGAVALQPLLLNLVVNELQKQAGWSTTPFRLSHLRDRNGLGCDLVVETARGLITIDVAASQTASPKAIDRLRKLRDALGRRFLAGVLLHMGEAADPDVDRLHVLPLNALWASGTRY